MSDKPRPLWMIGRENFEHGAAARKRHMDARETKDASLGELHKHLNLNPKKRQVKNWKREELKKLWHMRYEQTPKATYDQLAAVFGGVDTQVIVDALTELRRRKDANNKDMFRPLGERDKPATPPIVSPAPKPYAAHIDERTQRFCILHGMGLTYRQIADETGENYNTISAAIQRLRKRHPSLYKDLYDKGAHAELIKVK